MIHHHSNLRYTYFKYILAYTMKFQVILRFLSLKWLLQQHGCSSPIRTYQPSTTKYYKKWTSISIYLSIQLQIPLISDINDEEEPLSSLAQDYDSKIRKIRKIRQIRKSEMPFVIVELRTNRYQRACWLVFPTCRHRSVGWLSPEKVDRAYRGTFSTFLYVLFS